MKRELKVDFKVEKTLSKPRAFAGADFVIATISTGGFDSMQHDIDIPIKYGISQPVGDTIGPGGLSRALRNIPVFIDMAHQIERYCPDAWFLNYTNPMAAITRAITKETTVKTIGLCHELFNVLQIIAGIFGIKKWRDIPVTLAGVNHLAWIIDFKINGKEGMPKLIEMAKKGSIDFGGKTTIKLANKTHELDKNTVKFEMLKAFGALPAAGDRHIVEFFPYFLTEKNGAGKAFNVELTTIKQRKDVWLADAIKDVRNYNRGKKKLSKQRSNEAISRIMASLSSDKAITEVVNFPNRGQIPELPLDVVVETMSVVGNNAVRPLAAGRLPKPVLAISERMVKINELTVEAALAGDREKALQVLLLDPLTRDFRDAEKMLNELLKANRAYLPQFFKS